MDNRFLSLLIPRLMLLFLIVTGVVSCASGPIPKSTDVNHGGIAIKAKALPPMMFLYAPVDSVAFGKLGDEEDPNAGTTVVRTNYASGGYLYLLDIEPGKYVLVAAGTISKTGSTFGIASGLTGSISSARLQMGILPKEVVESSVVTVEPGKVAFMGEYKFDIKMLKTLHFEPNDETQAHYFKVMYPKGEQFAGDMVFGAILDEHCNDEQCMNRFNKSYDAMAKDTPWASANR